MNHIQPPNQIQPYGNPHMHYPAHPAGYAPIGYGIPVEDDEESKLDLLRLAWYAIHYRWLIAAFLVTGLVLGFVFTYLQTPKYRATSQIEIQTAGAKVIEDLEVVSNSTDFRVFETARQKMLSRDLAQRVAFELDLANNPDFLAPAPTFSLGNLVRRITGGTPQADIGSLSPDQRSEIAIETIREGLGAELKRNTSLLAVSFSHPLPEYAEKVSNQVVRSYIDQSLDKRSETSDLARQFITEQVKETKQRLQESEKALVTYAQDQGITLTGDDTSLVSANIAEINKTITEFVQDRLELERLVQQIDEGNASALPEVFKSGSIQATKEKIADFKASYQEKLSTLKPGFPEMVRLRAQIQELEKQINLEVGSIALSTKIQYQQVLDKEKALKDELTKLEAAQGQFQQKNIQYTILKREVDSNRAQYDSLINKLNDVGVGAELRSTNASIVDLAVKPKAPYTPRLTINLAAALALFSMLAAGLIFVLEMMNNTFSVPDQIERDLKLSVLGIIPHTPEDEFEIRQQDPKSALSEAYRTLRTSLQFTGTDDGTKTITITSAAPSEGKSSTSMRLAIDFAALGKKVLLIDADMRKPKLHRLLNTHNAIGLSNLMTNVVKSGDIGGVFQKTAHPNLTFLSSGTIPPNPADILMSQKLGLMLQFCKNRYDLIIIDSPPTIGLSDALILSRQADATLLVVATRQATRKSVANALKRLKSSGANVVGAAMTKFAVNDLDYNYAYRYMQNNYYQYDNDQETSPKLKLAGRKAASDSGHSGGKSSIGSSVSDFFGKLSSKFS